MSDTGDILKAIEEGIEADVASRSAWLDADSRPAWPDAEWGHRVAITPPELCAPPELCELDLEAITRELIAENPAQARDLLLPSLAGLDAQYPKIARQWPKIFWHPETCGVVRHPTLTEDMIMAQIAGTVETFVDYAGPRPITEAQLADDTERTKAMCDDQQLPLLPDLFCGGPITVAPAEPETDYTLITRDIARGS